MTNDQTNKSTGTTEESPHNIAAEMAVLGAILYDNNNFTRVDGLLLDTDFYAPANREIFRVPVLEVLGATIIPVNDFSR